MSQILYNWFFKPQINIRTKHLARLKSFLGFNLLILKREFDNNPKKQIIIFEKNATNQLAQEIIFLAKRMPNLVKKNILIELALKIAKSSLAEFHPTELRVPAYLSGKRLLSIIMRLGYVLLSQELLKGQLKNPRKIRQIINTTNDYLSRNHTEIARLLKNNTSPFNPVYKLKGKVELSKSNLLMFCKLTLFDM